VKKLEQALRGKGNIRLKDDGVITILDLGSQIPNPYFKELSDKFLVKKFYISF
jgi:hypothetical protein